MFYTQLRQVFIDVPLFDIKVFFLIITNSYPKHLSIDNSRKL